MLGLIKIDNVMVKSLLMILLAGLCSSEKDSPIQCFNATTQHRHDDVYLYCESSIPFHRAEWWYNEEQVTDIDPEVSGSNASLKFNPLDVTTRVGQYTCKFLNQAGDTIAVGNAFLNAYPVPGKMRLLSVDGNHTYHQQSVLTRETGAASIVCNINAYPAPKLFWYKDGTLVGNLPDNYRFKIIDSRLEIDFVMLEDWAEFTCIASNIVGNCTIKTQLRVRGRYAPVWPAIGIAIEVIILSAYIFFHRNKVDQSGTAASRPVPNSEESTPAHQPAAVSVPAITSDKRL